MKLKAKSFIVLFIVLLGLGLICILKSYDIGTSVLMMMEEEWDMNHLIFSVTSWIVFGGVISLISGYGLIKILLKRID